MAWGIRARVLETAVAQGGGYVSQACSSAEALALLYGWLMELGSSLGPQVPPPFRGVPGHGGVAGEGGKYNGPKGPHLDRFILSPAHYAQALYAVLVECGRLAPEALAAFNQDGSTLEMIGAEHSPGIEVSCGSFGQALAQAAGIAAARQRKGETGLIWVFMSDGEFQEGQTWETLLAAAFHKLDRLRVLVDVNGQQVDGRTAEVMNLEPLREKSAAFGWTAREIDGHDFEALTAALTGAEPGRPLIVLARTRPCQGLEPLAKRGVQLHYVRFHDAAEVASLRAHLQATAGGLL
jgi:transketolase